MIELIQGDCMEAMADMPDKAFDLAIVDIFIPVCYNLYSNINGG